MACYMSYNGVLSVRHRTIIWTNTLETNFRVRCQPIIWISAGLLLIGPLETHFSDIWIKTQQVSCKKMDLKMAYPNLPRIWLSRNVLSVWYFGFVEPNYNTVYHCTVLRMVWWWQVQNIDHIINSQNTQWLTLANEVHNWPCGELLSDFCKHF